MAFKILLTSPAKRSKCWKTITQDVLLLIVKNLKLYQHFIILEMLLYSLMSLLVFALLESLPMNYFQY